MYGSGMQGACYFSCYSSMIYKEASELTAFLKYCDLKSVTYIDTITRHHQFQRPPRISHKTTASHAYHPDSRWPSCHRGRCSHPINNQRGRASAGRTQDETRQIDSVLSVHRAADNNVLLGFRLRVWGEMLRLIKTHP
jgi:hypothetical protein